MQRDKVDIGILLAGGMPYPKIIELAVEFEQHGLDFVYYGDGHGSAVFPQLAGIAAATKRIRLGSLIVSIFSSSPIVIASSIACVDQLSNGRAMLGLGASVPELVTSLHGFKYEKPAARMRDYVQIIRQLLNKERGSAPVSHHGEIISLDKANIDLLPVQDRLPIQIAAFGPQMLCLAGALADSIIVEYVTPAFMSYARALIDEGAHSVGRDPDEVNLTCLTWLSIDETPDAAINRLKPLLTRYCSFDLYNPLWQGTELMSDAMHVREAYQSGDLIEAVRRMSDRLIKTITIAGTVEQCRHDLQQWIATLAPMGVNQFVFAVAPKADREAAYREALAVLENINSTHH